jgi:hypothetical protein
MIGGWHWPGRTALAADWRILLPSPGGEATLFKIAAHCDDRGMTTRRFPPPWRADKNPMTLTWGGATPPKVVS